MPSATYEGDNVVLALQTARYLVKSRRQVLDGVLLSLCGAFVSGVDKTSAPVGKQLFGGVKYLENEPGRRCTAEVGSMAAVLDECLSR